MKINSVACIGCGVMGSALIKAVCKTVDPGRVFVSDADPEKAEKTAAAMGCHAVSNRDAVRAADCIFLAVKPAHIGPVLGELGEDSRNKLFVSMAAGVTLGALADAAAENTKLIRIMPNVPVLVGEGMIGISPGPGISAEELVAVRELLAAAGLTEVVPETLMDGVTAVSGSGPAYGFIFIEALADAAVRFGIPREQAVRYAAQTLKGAAAMVLETGRNPGELKDSVCSPAGTTIEAVYALERGGFRAAVMEAAEAAWIRSKELGETR
ncbi:MAG: pyrroline-5-carboxylate reductase [Spirochaetaceae bacterium]|jgi:pyrroline-5-carboxylate reductase|nr:pyrroline-5-carboxylate reductase [Spirochaetaceae bacterium]